MRAVLMYSPAAPSTRHLGRLAALSPDLEIVAVDSAAEAEPAVRDAEVILGHRFLDQVLPHATRLRWVQASEGGIDRRTLADLAARGVTLTRSPLEAEAVAAHAVALAWALARGLPDACRNQSAHRWQQAIPLAPLPRRALVLGGGAIARAIAARLGAQGLSVVCPGEPAADEDKGVPHSASLAAAEWRDALPRSDWCFLALPAGPGTGPVFDEAALRALPGHAVLVNVGVSDALDTAALIRALEAGHLCGAGLDPLGAEPLPPGHPLWDAPRLLLTPHVAARRPGRTAESERFFEAQLRRYLAGQPLEAVVTLAKRETRPRRNAARPLVSIVIPAYKTRFLEAALASAFGQTYRNVEIVVSDNCPTDDVRSLVTRHPRVRYHRNPVRGVYSNFRSCIRLARGEYVKFLLDDDLLTPDCVEVMVKTLSARDDVALVAAGHAVIDADGRQLSVSQLPSDKPVLYLPGDAGRTMASAAKNIVGSLTTSMFRRRLLPLGLGPWFLNTGTPERYAGLVDMAFILDLAFQGSVVLLPGVLSAVRRHPDQLSNATVNPLAYRSVATWRALATDAHAFGLLSDDELQRALQDVLAMLRRWTPRFPELVADIPAVEAAIARLASHPVRTEPSARSHA